MHRMKLFIVACLLIRPNVWGLAPADERILDKRIIDYELRIFGPNDANWESTFGFFCEGARLRCGFAFSSDRNWIRSGPTRTERLPQPSVRAVLDKIVGLLPGYRWFIDKGVINLVPIEFSGDRGNKRNPLARRIRQIDLVEVPLNVAASLICREAGLGCPRAPDVVGGGGLGSGDWQYRKVSLQLSEMSFGEALNELVRKDGRSTWTYCPRSGFLWLRPAEARVSQYWGGAEDR